MIKYSRFNLFSLILLGCSLLATQAKAPSGNWEHLFEGSRLIAGKDGAWIVQEPKVVSTGYVEGMVFGPGVNEAVLLVRPSEVLTQEEALNSAAPAPYEKGGRLRVVNLSNGSSRPLNLPNNIEPITGIGWMNEGRVLLVFYRSGTESRIAAVDALSGSALDLGDAGKLDFAASAVPAMALVIGRDDSRPNGKRFFRVLDFSSGLPQARDFPAPERASVPLLLTKDFTVLAASGDDALVEVSLVGGAIKDWPAEAGYAKFGLSKPKQRINYLIAKDPRPGLYLTVSPGLRSEFRLSKEADKALIDSQGSRVLFRAHGAAFVSQLTPVNLELALKSLTDKAIERAKFLAKQAGTATAIYAADHDGTLPISSASARDSIYPYARNSQIRDNVVWTNIYGQRTKEFNDPSKIELGYVPGPGGRAIIFADSHVEWRPDP